MIKQLNQSVACICPACASMTAKPINIFKFSGSNTVEITCGVRGCGEAIASISQKDDKYRITAECPFCGYTHEFSIKKAFFWSTDFFAFNCPIADLSLFFLGDKKKVAAEIKKQEQLLDELSDEFESETELSLLFDLVSLINDMFKSNAVVCECGSKNISMNIDEGDITLTCKDCLTTMLVEPSQNEYDRLKNAPILRVTE